MIHYDYDENVLHMVKYHGFFLPDEEYLQDRKGLITYLADKIDHEHLCLYCNGRGKEWKTAQAARAHMVSRRHLFIRSYPFPHDLIYIL